MTEVIRVSVNVNFNCTEAEYKQLEGFKLIRPQASFFVNSNIKTPALLSLNDHDFQAVVTVNPDLDIDRALVERLYKLDPSKVAFVRVKYLPHNEEIRDLVRELSGKGYNVVLTAMRFLCNDTVNQYSDKKHYVWECSWFRLNPENFAELESFADSFENVYICDRKGLGCSECGLCSTLTVGADMDLYSLNMSASGICPFDCVDCYAKKMQFVLKCLEKSPIRFDLIRKNNKQSGKTAHIQRKRGRKNVKSKVA